MDIKSKNKYVYIVAFIICAIMFGLSRLSVADVMSNKNYLRTEPYFTSAEFKTDLVSYFNNIQALNGVYKDYSSKSDDDKVTKEELISSKAEYDSNTTNEENEIKNKYSSDILSAKQEGNKEKVSRITEAQDKELAEFEKENTKTLEDMQKEIAAYKTKDYEAIKTAVKEKGLIKYYITSGEIIDTNLVNVSDINLYIKNNALYSIKNNWLGNSGKAYFIIPKDIEKSSFIYTEYNYYNSVRQRIIKEAIIGFVSFIIGLLMLIYISKKKNDEMPLIQKLTKWYNVVPLDLRIFIFVIYSLIMNVYIRKVMFFYKPYNYEHIYILTIMAIYMFYFYINCMLAYNLYKNREEFRKQVKTCIFNKLSKKGIIILTLLAAAAVPAAVFAFMMSSMIIIVPIVYFLCYLLFIMIYYINKIRFFKNILKGTEEIVSGNLNYTIKEKGRGNLFKLAHNINNMKAGFKKSLENEIKSERLKSELITNVSHDLKTPLTSIINYVDLLKKEDLTNEQAKGYIEVLDRKSQRLKMLIDDLFEASKMASGAVELNLEKVDVTALLQQSLAELHEKINSSSLIFKVKIPEEKVYANLDGKKTWRVFENLINNILKYSLPKTRVYIDLIEENNNIIITMKNISAYEMDFDNSEIFERFKRGDESRNTEGSGLGLAIAKGILELQGGSLSIEIDGDLFKAVVIVGATHVTSAKTDNP
ncbi:sensor histidine kinase [Clostridium sp.]|uniref:sensor histidine kinase n=1 Tax=Clostridium sp. TaxID=1506 RepID=UPI003EF0820F